MFIFKLVKTINFFFFFTLWESDLMLRSLSIPVHFYNRKIKSTNLLSLPGTLKI